MAIGAAGALVKLVKLCVSALQRAEQQPLMLFPTASPVKTSRFGCPLADVNLKV